MIGKKKNTNKNPWMRSNGIVWDCFSRWLVRGRVDKSAETRSATVYVYVRGKWKGIWMVTVSNTVGKEALCHLISSATGTFFFFRSAEAIFHPPSFFLFFEKMFFFCHYSCLPLLIRNCVMIVRSEMLISL